MEFVCPVCGDKTLCYHEIRTHKTPLAFENGVFEPAGKAEEIEIDGSMPMIRCGNGHVLEFISEMGFVLDKDDMKRWLKEREQINES